MFLFEHGVDPSFAPDTYEDEEYMDWLEEQYRRIEQDYDPEEVSLWELCPQDVEDGQ